MTERLGTKLGEWLYRQGKVEENQIDLIRFAFEIICSEITETLIIFGYGILSGHFIQTLMYLFFFHTLRHFFQGYHAKTVSRCLVLTVGAYLISMMSFAYVTYEWGELFLVVSFLLQMEYCIKKHQYMPMIISTGLKLVVWFCALRIANIWGMQLLIVVEFIISVSLLPERRTYEEQNDDGYVKSTD